MARGRQSISISLSTCSGQALLTTMISPAQEEGADPIPAFQVSKLRVRGEKRLAQGPLALEGVLLV
jgi:hypothetical protein